MTLRLAYMTGEYFRVSHTFIRREAAYLRSVGHHVQVISVRRPRDGENLGPEGEGEKKTAIFLLPASPISLAIAHFAEMARSPRRYFSAMGLAWRTRVSCVRFVAYFAEAAILARVMRRENLSHLHNHFSSSSCSVAMIAAEMGGFTFSFTVHGPAEFFEASTWGLGEKVKRALFVNCISYFCRSQVMVFAPAEDWAKLRVVHCGVDMSQFEFSEKPAAGKNLLFVGRLAAAKGLPVLLEAMRELPEATLTLAGDGPDRGLLERMARELGMESRVRFLGYQTPQQVRELLNFSDLFVMSSFAEGVPVVLMEAMACGLPVVATRIAGIPELVIDGENGLLVTPGDVKVTAEAIARLLADAEMRKRMGAAGRKMVEREFNLNLEGAWLNRILSGALAGKSEGIRP